MKAPNCGAEINPLKFSESLGAKAERPEIPAGKMKAPNCGAEINPLRFDQSLRVKARKAQAPVSV